MNENLISYLNDRINKLVFFQKAMQNTPSDFKMGDKICILSGGIDSFYSNKYKDGMHGYVDNIMHRYVGEPSEHYEYWITVYDEDTPIGRSRWNINEILQYSQATDILQNAIHDRSPSIE